MRYSANVDGDILKLSMSPMVSGELSALLMFSGKRIPPLPPKPDLSTIEFGKPIELFNGRNLDGWRLTNPKQVNGWKAVNGELVNVTEKLDFSAYSKYGNLPQIGSSLISISRLSSKSQPAVIVGFICEVCTRHRFWIVIAVCRVFRELVPFLGVSYLPKMLVSREGSGTAMISLS